MQADFEIARWGQFELDVRRRLLLASGKPVKLDAIAFDLLVCLIARRDAPVTRDDIQACVWPGRIVEPGNVTVQLSAIRSAFRKVGDTQPHILTLPGPRYHFVADVTIGAAPPPAAPEPSPPEPSPPEAAAPEPSAPEPETAGPAPPKPPRQRRRIGVASAGLIPALAALLLAGTMLYRNRTPPAPGIPRLSMVVVPFRYQSADQSQHYLADGITDDLTIDLAHIPTSTVIARESAEAVKSEIPPQIRRDLQVAYEITGTVMPEDQSFHVSAELIDTATGKQLWSNTWDEPRDFLSIARQEIVNGIASNLHFQLDQLESTRSLHDRPDNPDAIDLFLRARARLDWDHSPEGFRNAGGLLEQAIAKNPNFADAKAELGWMLLRKVTTLDDPDETSDFKRASSVIAEALTLSPKNAKAMSARARELQENGDCDEAEPQAEAASEVEPSSVDPHTVLASCDMAELMFKDAISQYERILRLDPASPSVKRRYLAMGTVRLLQGEAAAAVDLLNKALAGETDSDTDPNSLAPTEPARFLLIAANELKGDHGTAVRLYESYAVKWPRRTVWRMSLYLPKPWASLPGFRNILRAVDAAGMHRFSSQDAPIPFDTPCVQGDFAQTPGSLKGAETLTTDDVRRWLVSPRPPLLIDLGHGRASPPGTDWRDPVRTDETPEEYALDIAQKRHHSSREIPIIVFADGVTGCSAYKAAKSLVDNSYSHVGWYRGGEEDWAKFEEQPPGASSRN